MLEEQGRLAVTVKSTHSQRVRAGEVTPEARLTPGNQHFRARGARPAPRRRCSGDARPPRWGGGAKAPAPEAGFSRCGDGCGAELPARCFRSGRARAWTSCGGGGPEKEPVVQGLCSSVGASLRKGRPWTPHPDSRAAAAFTHALPVLVRRRLGKRTPKAPAPREPSRDGRGHCCCWPRRVPGAAPSSRCSLSAELLAQLVSELQSPSGAAGGAFPVVAPSCK